ncbi:hypothetical protein LWI29_004192 [Acer saccharum]|uniref:Phospholipase D n=1 Tax=Acer saccharum TaxID=4024 RepID=A0AA39VSI0_ACESA|nr:hypothetical protein LWI29_004192 [Acer saccharum]KAK1567312.1 hypothetical protein Q3G72_010730 [Acer saccharum]
MSGPDVGSLVLHGDLDLRILEAKCLPNMDMGHEKVRKCFSFFRCRSPFRRRRGHKHASMTSDPYVSVCLAGATVAQTRIIDNCEDPLWDEHFCVPVAHPVAKVMFHVKDNDVVGADLIGIVEIPAEKIFSGNEISDWFPILGDTASSSLPQLRLSIKFTPVQQNPLYKEGVGGVPNTYFPLRKGGNVTLYQDAHVPADSKLPEILLGNGKLFQHGKCWEDICHAIVEARHLIYIIGWSVFHPVKLLREPTKPLPAGGELSLGELLKHKSRQGLCVVLLIWDDKTSHDKFLIKTEGVMQTHDEETRKFFKDSNVHCVLAPRYASNKLSVVKQQVVGTLFAHHQKCVLVDTQASGNNRKITAFIGGLDLCDGRYDTPEHRLFTDLDTVFADDFHNPTIPPNARSPRQPWHDLHCKIEGPAAYDILTNFEQRWRKATKARDQAKRQDHVLINLEGIILTPSTGHDGDTSDEKDSENWHVQVFRSIDSGSAKGFPKDVKQVAVQNLAWAKNLKVDRSIQTAYVKAIRSAQHFIYIENQYFIGSSYYWSSYKNAGAVNLVPIELALKIASKIRANERFAVYIVIPMWPEGVPSSAPVQEILYWQEQTMSMMYKIVAEALDEKGLSDRYDLQDYLNFYCLGKREDLPPGSSAETNSALVSVQKFRRFMIYVHSKGMIVDDEYVVMGSANINQRSLDGSRDTEIGMGAYQPNYTWAEKKSHPHGQVYGYRMSLWAEHLARLEDAFKQPQKLECVQHVNQIATHNWEAYVSEEDHKKMRGHLMRYPVQVNKNGKVSTLAGHRTFPDVGGNILGAPNNLPDALTT